MKAIRVHEYGGPEAMQFEEVPTPAPGAGEALVSHGAVGINFIDIYQRSGQYRLELPFTAGNEAAGKVVAVGQEVTEAAVGDRVVYWGQLGAYAEYSSVEAWRLVPVPDQVDDSLAAALILQGMTVQYRTHSTYGLGTRKARSS